jgi:hypothetical protein
VRQYEFADCIGKGALQKFRTVDIVRRSKSLPLKKVILAELKSTSKRFSRVDGGWLDGVLFEKNDHPPSHFWERVNQGIATSRQQTCL